MIGLSGFRLSVTIVAMGVACIDAISASTSSLSMLVFIGLSGPCQVIQPVLSRTEPRSANVCFPPIPAVRVVPAFDPLRTLELGSPDDADPLG